MRARREGGCWAAWRTWGWGGGGREGWGRGSRRWARRQTPGGRRPGGAAAGGEEFGRDRPVPDAPVIAGPGGEERRAVLGMSADAKGVSMRPDALRAETARKAAKRDRKGDKRLGSGEKQAKKRMAETGAVFDSLPPDGEPRTPQDIMLPPARPPPPTPQPGNNW